MSLSHLSLTVDHLPTATAFFGSCLKPLGYKYIGRQDDSIGFGHKYSEPAEFWIAERKPGAPAGAAHLAFLAPSKDAVGNFFLAALKAGGKLHGEPQIRDVKLRYYSAVVLDADGNRVEAVYCPGDSSAQSEVSASDMSSLDDRSFVSKAYSRASSTRPESTISRSRSEAKSYASRATTAVDRGPSADPASQSQVTQKKPDETSPAARTIVGSLIGAAAGAAIAYAWTSSGQSGQSDEQADPSRASAQYTSNAGPSQSRSREDPPEAFRAIDDGRSMASSRGPRSAYEGGLSEKMSDMTIDANRDIPVRALEYSPSMWDDDDRSATSSAVRSYVDKPSKSKSKAGSSGRISTLPEGSVASFSSYRTGASKSKSSASARHVPLPESVVGVDVDTNVTPDDSISQVPINDYDEGSTYSRRSSSKAGGGGSSRSRVSSSKKSSTFDEPVRPGDSVSQVSCNTRATEKTAKPGSSRAGGSRRQAV